MKKTFELSHPKIKPARQVDAIKHELKKYVKRERNKQLPIDADYWDFDCKFGDDENTAEDIHLSGLNKAVDKAIEKGLTRFYIEIVAKGGIREFTETDSED